jgi:hypothetical protein
MPRFTSFGKFLVGLGVIVGGVAAAWSALNPALIETAEDIVDQLKRIADATEQQEISLDADQSRQVASALSNVSSRIAQAADVPDGDLPFVPKSFVGVQDYRNGEPFDFEAPNGTTRLLTLRTSTSRSALYADGERVSSMVPGENAEIAFGNHTCRFDIISVENGDPHAQFLRIAASHLHGPMYSSPTSSRFGHASRSDCAT